MRLVKHGADTVYYIRHCLRALPPSQTHGNTSIDETKRDLNESIVCRYHPFSINNKEDPPNIIQEKSIQAAKETNEYRKKVMKKIHRYNRNNIVETIEFVQHIPDDLVEDKKLFYKEFVSWICHGYPTGITDENGKEILGFPLKEESIILAEVNRDEGKIKYKENVVVEGKEHIHVLAIPAVPTEKYEGYHYKLSADSLTRKKTLHRIHQSLQDWMNSHGIHCTIYDPNKSGSKGYKVDALKELTEQYGVTLDQLESIKRGEISISTPKKEIEIGNTDTWGSSGWN